MSYLVANPECIKGEVIGYGADAVEKLKAWL